MVRVNWRMMGGIFGGALSLFLLDQTFRWGLTPWIVTGFGLLIIMNLLVFLKARRMLPNRADDSSRHQNGNANSDERS